MEVPEDRGGHPGWAIQAGLVPEKQTHSLLYLEGPLVTHVP